VDLGFEKLVIVAVVALIVLGPDKLPTAMRTLGKAVSEFRRFSGGFQGEVRSVISGFTQVGQEKAAGNEVRAEPSRTEAEAVTADNVPPPGDDTP
jgi:Tat protein translocase TatB subunit